MEEVSATEIHRQQVAVPHRHEAMCCSVTLYGTQCAQNLAHDDIYMNVMHRSSTQTRLPLKCIEFDTSISQNQPFRCLYGSSTSRYQWTTIADAFSSSLAPS